jgi:hypothetical protein
MKITQDGVEEKLAVKKGVSNGKERKRDASCCKIFHYDIRDDRFRVSKNKDN